MWYMLGSVLDYLNHSSILSEEETEGKEGY